MSRPLRDLPRINYNWQIQAKLAETNKDKTRTGKPQRRGTGSEEMEDEEEFQSPMDRDKDPNTSILTTADEADFTGLNEDQLKRKIKNRAAKLNIYRRKFLETEAITIAKAEIIRYVNKIKDQMEYLDILVTHCEEQAFEEAKEEADELITDLQEIVEVLEKQISKEQTTKNDAVTGITPISKVNGESGVVTAENQIGCPKTTQTVDRERVNKINTSTPINVTETTPIEKSQVTMLRKRVEMLNSVIEAVSTKQLNIGEDRLRSVKATDLPKIEQAKNELSKLFDTHINQCEYEELCNKMLEYIGKSVIWIQNCHEAIQEARLDITDDSRNNIEPIKLERFMGWKSDSDIYMFLEDFNRHLSSARTSTKLSALYKNYLSQEVAKEVEHYYLSEDYHGLIDFLVTKYGNSRRIIENKKKQIAELKYNFRDLESQIHYFRSFQHVLLNLEALIKKHGDKVQDLDNEIYNLSFLQSLAHCLPDFHKRAFIKIKNKEERKKNLKLSEKEEFEMFKTYISCELTDLETFLLEHGSSNTKHDTSKDERGKKIAVHNVDTGNKYEEGFKKKEVPKTGRKFEARKVLVKCPMHDFITDFKGHPVGKCKDFLSATPKLRLEKITNLKICPTCLGDWCGRNRPECCNIKLVPKALICQDCQQKDIKPLRNILVCPDHKSNLDQIKGSLDYLYGYEKGSNIQISHVVVNHMKADNNYSDEHAYNVTTGEVHPVKECGELMESRSDSSIYLFQMLSIGGEDCLTMFDSGSNGEAIEGEFAELVGFKCIDPSNQNIAVAGGATIPTGYGVFRCIIGPLTNGKFVNKTVLGLKQITQHIPEYEICEINDELRSYPSFSNETLPPKIGGMTTKMLIGIGSTEIFPEKIMELPDGLGVYRGKITDKYNSTIVYGGPHRIFTKANEGNFHRMTILFTELYNSYQHSLVVSSGFNFRAKDDQLICAEPYFNYKGKITDCDSEINATPIERIDRESINTVHIEAHHDTASKYNHSVLYICSNCAVAEGIVDANEQVHVLLNPDVSINKIRKPIKYLKKMEEDDELLTYTYRCSKCQSCSVCLSADKTKMLSVQEEEEDKLIENSVRWDKDGKKMYCSYPWIHDPISTLRKFWGKDSNQSQAMAIFKQQTKKPLVYREGAIKFHQELVDKGFVKKVTELSQKQQELINKSPVHHFFPWRTVWKQDSVSTPCRIVTDPSITHFNELCAKGSNNLANLYAMLVNFRTYIHTYAFDISKMYNSVRLEDHMLPFSLYYMSPNLGPNDPIELWCFLTLIYGIISAGNIAMFAVRHLAEQYREKEPLAHEALTRYLYMDDGFSGKNDMNEVNATIESIQRVLPQGGFEVKCMTRSGDDPSEKASSDGIEVGLAGYRWLSKQDQLKLGTGEINFNPKIRGYRTPNETEIKNEDDLDKIIPEKITRRITLGKTAEFWEPLGCLEPLKVKFKLDLKELQCYDWDDKISEALADMWKRNFCLMIKAREIPIRRSVVPANAIDPNSMELIATCDASARMCATAIYARFKLRDGSYSCALLTAKSRSSEQTVPRNELSGMVLAAETMHTILKTCKDRIKNYIICSDSTIAISWLCNTEKILKQFCFNRVRQCSRLVDSSCWRHIPGNLNPSDLATKGEVNLDDFKEDSFWFSGYPWMREDLDKAPIRTYNEICDSLNKEEREIIEKETVIDPQIKINHIVKEPAVHFIDFIKLGFPRAFNRLMLVLKFVSKVKHRIHKRVKQAEYDENCKYCFLSKETFDSPAFQEIEADITNHLKIPEQTGQVTTSPMDNWITWNWIHTNLTRDVKSTCTKSKTESYIEHNGILYSGGRLSTLDHIETVDDLNNRITPFYQELRYLNPVGLITNPIVYSLIIYLHVALSHCGVERLISSMYRLLYVEKMRPVVRRIRNECTMCRLKLLKSYRLRVQDQSRFTYTLAPPFYASQVDIISKFKAYDINVRSTCECHVLILVCCLTQAVALYVLERYDTASVIQALTRHSSRYAYPKYLLPDEGAQLLKLKDLQIEFRDLQARLWTQQRIILDTCNPKAHNEHGRVESRIASVRDSLKSILKFKHSLLGWETVFAHISSVLNSIPITRGNDDRGVINHEYDLITPFLCILGHNSNRALDGTVLLEKLPSRHMEKVKVSLTEYYKSLIGIMHRLIPSPNKWKSSDQIKVNDVVLFLEGEGIKYDRWKYGRVAEVNVDGKASKIRVSYRNANEKNNREVYRNPRNCVPIWKEDDIDFNTTAHFRAVTAQLKHEKP